MNIANEITSTGISIRTKSGLTVGQVLTEADIQTALNISMPRRGIRFNATKTDLVIITSIDPISGAMSSTPYIDKFYPELQIFTMTGEGLEGPQRMIRGNDRLNNHKQNGTDVHLLQKVGGNQYSYCGMFEVIKMRDDVQEPDKNGDPRMVYKFILTPII